MVYLEVGDRIMLRYLNGLFLNNYIDNLRTLNITISDTESGQPLLENVELMADLYKRQIDGVCFIGGIEDQKELSRCCKIIHRYGLKTAFQTTLNEPSEINKSLVDELDYIKFKTRTMKKDYCPFGDIEDWIDV